MKVPYCGDSVADVVVFACRQVCVCVLCGCLWLLTALGGSTLNALAVVIAVASFDTL